MEQYAMEPNARSLMRTARIAGLLYLIWTLTGLYGMFYVPSQINMRGDAAATAENIQSHEVLFRTTVVNDLVSCTIWVVMVLVFYRMFKQADPFQARFLVALVIVQIPIALSMEAFNITSLMIVKGEVLKTFAPAQRQDVAALFLKINDCIALTLETFWGLWLLPLAILVFRSRFLPRFLGVWLFITGLFYFALSFTGIMLPSYQGKILHSVFALPVELGEVAFMLWLLVFGARGRPPAAAESG
jgi:hypothetical protein